MNSGNRTSKAIDGRGGTDAWDIAEHPVQDPYLSERRDYSRNHLNKEQNPWWDLHVVP